MIRTLFIIHSTSLRERKFWLMFVSFHACCQTFQLLNFCVRNIGHRPQMSPKSRYVMKSEFWSFIANATFTCWHVFLCRFSSFPLPFALHLSEGNSHTWLSTCCCSSELFLLIFNFSPGYRILASFQRNFPIVFLFL